MTTQDAAQSDTYKDLKAKADKEVDQNYDIYEKEYKSDLERTDMGRHAVMHHGKIIKIYDDERQARFAAMEEFGLGNYSLVEIGLKAILSPTALAHS